MFSITFIISSRGFGRNGSRVSSNPSSELLINFIEESFSRVEALISVVLMSVAGLITSVYDNNNRIIFILLPCFAHSIGDNIFINPFTPHFDNGSAPASSNNCTILI